MKEILTLNDKGKWGLALKTEAINRGWNARFVDSPEDIKNNDAVLFARVAQDYKKRECEIPIIKKAAEIGTIMIPDINLLLEYESKILQAQRYKEWMPETDYITYAYDAALRLGKYGYPFVSKSSTGSASCNVRLVHNEAQAVKEIIEAFSENGIQAGHKLGEKSQKGYLLWQKLLSGNTYDYRACIVGDKVMLLRRGNRKDVPFASGSGITEPIKKLNNETAEVLEFAFRFFQDFNMEWCGIDIVKDPETQEWRMLETTIGWKQSAYSDCVFFDRDGNDTGTCGKDIWKVFCDYIRRYL
jgi:glutathione synthase/RimK-type ligase-like ATP-grasp enzyme